MIFAIKAIKKLYLLGAVGFTAVLITPSHPARAAVAYITVANYLFFPSTTNIQTGDTVVWTWSMGADDHNVVSASTPFAWLFPSPGGGPGTTSNQNTNNLRNYPFSFTNIFDSPGSFPYECTEHVAKGMVGTINVTASSLPPGVTITNPVDGEVFSAPANLTIQAIASGSSAVTNVQFLIGSTVLTNCVTAPFFAVTNDLPAGTYTIFAIASGANGMTATNSILVDLVTPNPLVAGTPAFVSPGTFQFSYSATVGLNYVVQVSTNLSDWTSLATNTATANPETFMDSNGGSNAAFYRVALLPNP